MGGDDCVSNLIELSVPEHALAHKISSINGLKLTQNRYIISKCLKESNDMTIKLNRLIELIEYYNSRNHRLNRLKSQKKKKCIQLIKLTDNTCINYNTVAELMQAYDITYHQVNILKTRKIRRSDYSEEFLMLFDNFKLTKTFKYTCI